MLICQARTNHQQTGYTKIAIIITLRFTVNMWITWVKSKRVLRRVLSRMGIIYGLVYSPAIRIRNHSPNSQVAIVMNEIRKVWNVMINLIGYFQQKHVSRYRIEEFVCHVTYGSTIIRQIWWWHWRYTRARVLIVLSGQPSETQTMRGTALN